MEAGIAHGKGMTSGNNREEISFYPRNGCRKNTMKRHVRFHYSRYSRDDIHRNIYGRNSTKKPYARKLPIGSARGNSLYLSWFAVLRMSKERSNRENKLNLKEI